MAESYQCKTDFNLREQIIIQSVAAWIPVIARNTDSHNRIMSESNALATEQADLLIKKLNISN
jgi:hypothetical protein